MPINNPYAGPGVRQPRMRILNAGKPIASALSFEVTNNNYYQADTFSAQFALNGDPNFSPAWWGQQQQILLDIQASLDNGSTWKSLILGQADHQDVHFDAGILVVDGRDLTARFIDQKTSRAYLNQTSSQLVQQLAQKHKMTADVTPTTTLVGRFYGDDHEKLSLNQFSRTTTEWNLMCSLAQHEGFDIWVTGTTVHFHPSTPINSDPWELVWEPPGWQGNVPWMNGVSLSAERAMTMAKDVVVVVRSWNSRQARGFTKYSPSNADLSSLDDNAVQSFVFIHPNLTEAGAQDMANKLREQITRNERLVTIEAAADLTVGARNMLKLTGTGTSWDQAYYVDYVRRNMSFEGGFSMTIHAKNHSPQTQVLP